MFHLACGARQPPINVNDAVLAENFYGRRGKNIIEDMVCFQQAAVKFLQVYKEKNLHMPWKNR